MVLLTCGVVCCRRRQDTPPARWLGFQSGALVSLTFVDQVYGMQPARTALSIENRTRKMKQVMRRGASPGLVYLEYLLSPSFCHLEWKRLSRLTRFGVLAHFPSTLAQGAFPTLTHKSCRIIIHFIPFLVCNFILIRSRCLESTRFSVMRSTPHAA